MTSVLPFSSLKRSKTFRHYINLPGYVTLYPDPGVTDPVTTKNNSITSDFWIISGVVLQIF